MKLLHVRQARAVWLLELRDLNPQGKDVRALTEWIKSFYRFDIGPNPAALSDPSKPPEMVFRQGKFEVGPVRSIEIGSLTLFNDGMVIDTISSTENADLFAAHLLDSAVRQFGLSFTPEMIRRRAYVSELIVTSDIELDSINPGLGTFASRISQASPETPKPQFGLAGFSFWTEPNEQGSHKVFTFERELGKFSSEKRYNSRAPLQTTAHLALLDEFERTVVGSSGSKTPK
jgi:hypothetical protein